MDERDVVTVFLTESGEVLLLRRSDAVGSYSDKWGGVAGHVETDPETAAHQEIREETGLEPGAVDLLARGEPFTVTDETLGIAWTVHPFRFTTTTRSIEPNWETSAFEWVDPPTIRERETVPDLWRSWDRVRPTVASVSADTTSGSATISLRALEVLRDEAALAPAGDWATVEETARRLREARAAMAVVQVRIDRVMSEASDRRTPDAVREAATAAIKRAKAADQQAAERAAATIDGDTVCTLSRSGTVERAFEASTPEEIRVAESRPGGEGVEFASTLAEGPASVSLYGDSSIPRAVGGADVVLVGADTVLSNGDVINKTGTLSAALAAARFDVPIYAVAATAKISPKSTWEGKATDSDASFSSVPQSVTKIDPPFERTPATLFDGIITEEGLLQAPGIREIAAAHEEDALDAQSLTWGSE